MGSIGQTFLGSIDQGTTSSRFLIFSAAGDVVASHQLEFRQIYPQPGWHEHDPLEIVSSVEKCIDGAVASFESQGHSIKTIKAIGITNQRETTVLENCCGSSKMYQRPKKHMKREPSPLGPLIHGSYISSTAERRKMSMSPILQMLQGQCL
ncbi:glycerol kinase [Histoplasma capsulatum]|uniref:Glycerol kinase n=1 Tax=Ajellomyces capsulatus TaxID=5037 RepID=A0A8A1M473_AJECA|nr:glycerol kinase [Histoplasma capsulatum]